MEKYLLVQHHDGITLCHELIVDSRAGTIRYSDTGIRMGRYGAILKTSFFVNVVGCSGILLEPAQHCSTISGQLASALEVGSSELSCDFTLDN